MTEEGGLNSEGVIFSIDTDGNGYKDLLDFNYTNGEYPYGSLTLSKGKLFGMTREGGAMNNGCIFSIDTNGNDYKDLLDFTGTNGGSPFGSLALSGNKLFGMTDLNFTDGNIFSIDTNGSGYNVLFNFNGYNGFDPQGDLILVGSKLYGMTLQGGVNGYGVIFSMDTNGNDCTVKVAFNNRVNPQGANSVGNLTLSGNILYGMTKLGGVNGYGVIFKLDTNSTTSINNLTPASASINVYPNPSNGIFKLGIRNYELGMNCQVEIYNVLGEKVYSQFNIQHPTFNIDLSGQANGVYFYRVLTENGELLGEGKVVIEH
jgi:uncharacterized repeat protein (TIGR03803 family)